MYPLNAIENDLVGNKSNKARDQMPLQTWERRMGESAARFKSESSILGVLSSSNKKTPVKNSSLNSDKISKSNSKQTPKSSNKNSSPSKSSENLVGDRFIPNRETTQTALGNYYLSKTKEEDEVFISPTKEYFQKTMNENLNGDKQNMQIIGYHQKAPEYRDAFKGQYKALYTSTTKKNNNTSKYIRYIHQSPERILDAPSLIDDYYLNLLDWSSNNLMGVCLDKCVYLWNANTGAIQLLTEIRNQNDYISSISFITSGEHIAVGTSDNEVQLWDINKQKKLRTMRGHMERVGVLTWNEHVLSSGSRDGFIHHHDVRVMNHLIGQIPAHQQEVCGLKWSPDGRYLASGGNDNMLNIYTCDPGHRHTKSQPIHSLNHHIAAVKALAWCPWQPHVLASGAGTADKHIRFWNCNLGTNLNNIDTKSQVCALLWSTEYKELVSSHGFNLNQLIIWSYPSMDKISELTGHTARVLHLSLSPDGSTVASGGADETLRLWKCFPVDNNKKKKFISNNNNNCSDMNKAFNTIR